MRLYQNVLALPGRNVRYTDQSNMERIRARKATTIIVFAEETDNEVLGLHALEGLRLEVDPVTKQLKEVEAVLAL